MCGTNDRISSRAQQLPPPWITDKSKHVKISIKESINENKKSLCRVSALIGVIFPSMLKSHQL